MKREYRILVAGNLQDLQTKINEAAEDSFRFMPPISAIHHPGAFVGLGREDDWIEVCAMMTKIIEEPKTKLAPKSEGDTIDPKNCLLPDTMFKGEF